MLISPVSKLLAAGLLTATSLTLPAAMSASAMAIAQPQASTSQLSGASRSSWLIADNDDDDDDDDDAKRGRGHSKKRDQKGTVLIERRVSVVTLQRAKNLARQAAEQANGGLSRYRAEASMHGPAELAPCVDNGDSWTFTFLGGTPGWRSATIESVVTVYKSTNVVRVDYNGPVRTAFKQNKWKGKLKLARLVNQNALVMHLDGLNKPATRSAVVLYQIFARRNNRWVSVYRSTSTQLMTTAGRVNLQPFVIPLNQLQLSGIDWSRVELKAIAQVNTGSQQIVLQEVVQRFQSITQITNIQQITTVPVVVRADDDDDDNDDD